MCIFENTELEENMAGEEYGYYDFRGVHIEMNNNSTEYDVSASSLHEFMHQRLAASTSIGALDFLLMNIYATEKDVKLRGKIKQLYERVSDSSIKVQESTAVFDELSMLKIFSEDDYRRVLKMYKDGQIYMKKYGFENLEFLLKEQNIGTLDREEKINNLSNNIFNIATKAMNVDFYKVNPLDGKYMKCLEKNQREYNANFRFTKIIKYIQNEGISITHEMTDEEIDNIFAINQLPVGEMFDWKKFSVWANSMICKPLAIKDFSEYAVYVDDLNTEERICCVSAYNSHAPLQKRILKTVEEIKASWSQDDILYIHFEESYYVNVLINLENKVQSVFFNKYALIDLASAVKMLFMDRNHYKKNIEECPKLVFFDTFVDIGNIEPYAISFMREECLLDCYIKRANELFCIIFFRGSFNTAFFLMYPLVQVPMLFETYFPTMYIQDSWWDDFIAEEKMEHFCKYLTMKE